MVSCALACRMRRVESALGSQPTMRMRCPISASAANVFWEVVDLPMPPLPVECDLSQCSHVQSPSNRLPMITARSPASVFLSETCSRVSGRSASLVIASACTQPLTRCCAKDTSNRRASFGVQFQVIGGNLQNAIVPGAMSRCFEPDSGARLSETEQGLRMRPRRPPLASFSSRLRPSPHPCPSEPICPE